MKRLLLALLLASALSAPAWAGFDEGFAAYTRGDYKTALREWRPLGEQGYAGAQFNLGVMYENGLGVEQDKAEAVKWYRRAAEQGNAIAQYNVGLMYFDGQGAAQDDAEAVKWWRRAAEQDHVSAQSNLGFMYHVRFCLSRLHFILEVKHRHQRRKYQQHEVQKSGIFDPLIEFFHKSEPICGHHCDRCECKDDQH